MRRAMRDCGTVHDGKKAQERTVYPWGDDLPYNSAAERLKERFGGRVQKVSLCGGFTCPNRDGRVGTAGCTFCNNEAFVPFYTHRQDIDTQIEEGLGFLRGRYPRTARFVAYFQAYTNTYGDPGRIKALYTRVLAHPEIQGLVVGTRPDCVDEDLLDFFAGLPARYFVSLEFGVESVYDDVLAAVNRGHDFAAACRAIRMTAERGIHTVGHFMFGLTDRSREMESVSAINALPLSSVKFHQLQVMRSTAMGRRWEQGDRADFHLFETREEYQRFIIGVLERLRPDLPVERFISETPPRYRLAPDWGLQWRVPEIRREIIAQMNSGGHWQGRKFY